MNEYRLSAASRGYKQAGKKLAPRDAGDLQVPGRNQCERRRYVAAETKHNEAMALRELGPYGGPDKYEQRVLKLRRQMSPRRCKPIDRYFEDMISSDDENAMYKYAFQLYDNAQWRYFSALYDGYCAALAQQADEQLLAYARG